MPPKVVQVQSEVHELAEGLRAYFVPGNSHVTVAVSPSEGGDVAAIMCRVETAKLRVLAAPVWEGLIDSTLNRMWVIEVDPNRDVRRYLWCLLGDAEITEEDEERITGGTVACVTDASSDELIDDEEEWPPKIVPS